MEEKTMAVVDQTNTVINTIVGDQNSPTEQGTYLIEVAADVYCAKGFTWDGTNFLNESGSAVFYESGSLNFGSIVP